MKDYIYNRSIRYYEPLIKDDNTHYPLEPLTLEMMKENKSNRIKQIRFFINVIWDKRFFAIIPALNINLHSRELEFEWLNFDIMLVGDDNDILTSIFAMEKQAIECAKVRSLEPKIVAELTVRGFKEFKNDETTTRNDG
ncbi:MAG: hypothetical protein LBP67_05090 [Bacteroidales bacterium]|jgi:hypothetical protein|nr:hypothetical protein [Bacteroidales bacterium]